MNPDDTLAAAVTEPTALAVCRPSLPRTDALLPYLRQIDQNAWYSNFGPLEVGLTARFADHFGLAREEVLLTSSGTVALTAALIAVARPGRRRCLMPSWTFVAGVGAAMAAGLTPHFCDVDAQTWAVDPTATAARDDLDDVAAVMITCPFGDPVDTAAWDAFTEATGIPVVIDAAAAFGSLDARAQKVGRSALIVSLHATKTFGVGEGGLLLSRSPELVGRAAAVINFGFRGSRVAGIVGLNGKLSEFAAAVGHAALDRWPTDRERWMSVSECYRTRQQAFARHGHLRLPVGPAWPTSTLNWLAESEAAAIAAEQALLAHKIDSRRWWGTGCHGHVAYAGLTRDPLPVTESLAGRCIGLPMSTGLEADDVERVAAVFQDLKI